MNIADFVTMRANDAWRDEREHVLILPTDSVRGPGWYRASCTMDDWETDGAEPVVEDARDDHIGHDHAVGRLIRGVHAAVAEYRRLIVDGDQADLWRRERIDALEDVLRRIAGPSVEHEDYDPAWRLEP